MKLIGFGCSFTYGSELIDPEIDGLWDDISQTKIWDRHYKNIPWRTNHSWLGRLAHNLGYKFDNLAQPANSNFAIAQQISSYFINTYDPQDKIIVCVGWTAKTRMSWYTDNTWTHNGFADYKNGWSESAREWVIKADNESHTMYTENAKFIVNSICKSMNIPIIQFNALGHHNTTKYPNYFIDGNSMDTMIRRAMQEDNRLDLVAKGGHPNEAGHEYFTIRLTEFVKSHIIT